MSDGLSLCILAVGANAPVGKTSLQVAACARAHKLEPRARAFLDKRGRAMGVCLAGDLPQDLWGYERWVALAAPALREAAEGLTGPLPLVVSMPDAERADEDPRAAGDFLQDVAAAAGIEVDRERSMIVRAGHAGGALAFAAAIERLRSGSGVVLVGGVDSYFHPQVLSDLDRACRLHAQEAENGLVPSEGAGFVALSRSGAKEALGASPLATLSHVGVAREETVVLDEPNLAEAMTSLLEGVVAARGGRTIDWIVNDLNGERHRTHEWSRLTTRGPLADGAIETRLASDLGDVGAATGPLYVAIACQWLAMRAGPANEIAIALHSEGPERGALLLRGEGRSRRESGAEALELAPGDAPARELSLAARDAVERVLIALRDLPIRVQRDPLVRATSTATTALASLSRSDIDDADHLDVLAAAAEALSALWKLLADASDGDGSLGGRLAKAIASEETALRKAREKTIDVIVARQDKLLHTPPPAERERRSRPFVASRGEPTLHALDGAAIAPVVATGGAPPAVEKEPEPEVDEPFEPSERDWSPEADDPDVATFDKPLLARLARDCVEDLAALSALRDAVGSERFWPESVARFEQRMACDIDALMTLAPRGALAGIDVAAHLQHYVADAPAIDGERPFARTLVLGSIEGDDAARAAVLALKQSHAFSHAAQREAFILAPSPAIAPAMRRLSTDPDAALAALALDVLRERREASFADAMPLITHPDPAVRTSAARALGVAAERAAAIPILTRVLDVEDDDRVAAAAATSLTLQGSAEGLSFARQQLLTEQEEPGTLAPDARLSLLFLLALAGARSDADQVLACLHDHPEEARAVGWFGSPLHVEALVTALEQVRPGRGLSRTPFEAALSRALFRITGATPGEGDGAAIDMVTGRDAHDAEGGAFGHKAWRAWLDAHRETLKSGAKQRFGAPYALRATLDELSQAGARADDRKVAEIELDLATEGACRVRAGDWLSRQTRAIAAARAQIEAKAAEEAETR